jgi:hypothetical protein
VSSGDNPLNHLGRDIRILAALIDALIADEVSGSAAGWKVLGALETAIQQEIAPREKVTTDRDRRAMQAWGAVDQDGIYAAAGLSARQTEVAHWHYDLGMTALEMSLYFGGDPIRIGANLQEVREKLAALGRRTGL